MVLCLLFPSDQDSSQIWTVALVLGFGGVALGLRLLPAGPANPITVPEQISREAVQQVLTAIETLLTQLAEVTPNPTARSPFQPRLAQLTTDLDRREMRLLILGDPAVGKSSVQALLQTQWLPEATVPCQITEAHNLLLSSLNSDDTAIATGTPVTPEPPPLPEPLTSADVVLFVIQGDLTDSEYQALQRLQSQQKRVLVLLNKQDQYLPTQRLVLQRQLHQRLSPWLQEADMVAIAAQPQPTKVRRHQADGSWQDFQEQPPPQIEDLCQRLTQLVSQEAEPLILTQTYQAALALQAEIQGQLNQVRRELAQPIIERYQWITSATAFANPFPTLDLLATAAISGKMVMELGRLYRLQFSLAQAQAVATTLAGAMLQLGLVEVSTQALGTLLKGHAYTYVAGGLLQGVSAAHLTRVAGWSLVEHFQGLGESAIAAPASQWDPENLKQILSSVFQRQQQADALKGLVQSALGRFRGQSAVAEAPAGS